MMRRTTAQLRMGFWIQGLELFKHSPIFGIGQGNFLRVAGKVVHNSFLQSFTELGFFGGTLFLGAFFLAWWQIFLLSPRDINDSQLARLRPYLLAMLTTWIVGMMSLTRSYVPPTYMMLGLATVYLVLSGEEQPRVSARLLMQLISLSAMFLAGVFVFVHVFHRGS
jgi:O-antigen ligase